MQVILLAVFILLCNAQSYQHTTQLTPGYALSWSVIDDTIVARVDVQAIGWVGFGLSPVSHGMPQADFWIGIMDPNTGKWNVSDYYRAENSNGRPELDTTLGGTNDLLSFAGAQSGTVTTIKWSRKLVTADTGFDSPFATGPLNVVYAWGTSNAFASHGNKNVGMAVIDFFAAK